jgi:propanol-preferring alcohol dehydrogenase
MKVMLMTAVNQPLSSQAIADPQPGPGQVRIRLHATGVCGTDIHVWRGELPVPLPIVPGHEPVGTVDAVGPGVGSLRHGDRVGVSWFQGGCGRCARRKSISFARRRRRGSVTEAATQSTW